MNQTYLDLFKFIYKYIFDIPFQEIFNIIINEKNYYSKKFNEINKILYYLIIEILKNFNLNILIIKIFKY